MDSRARRVCTPPPLSMMLNTRIDLPLPGETTKEPLGLAPYADALADFVKTCETPLTVGIQGDWGIGKTSLLNLVRHRLEDGQGKYDRREYPTVYFNTWQYAQLDGEQHLTVALLGDLVRRIGALDRVPPTVQDQARGLLRTVGRMAASAGSQVIESKLGVSVEKMHADATGRTTTCRTCCASSRRSWSTKPSSSAWWRPARAARTPGVDWSS